MMLHATESRECLMNLSYPVVLLRMFILLEDQAVPRLGSRPLKILFHWEWSCKIDGIIKLILLMQLCIVFAFRISILISFTNYYSRRGFYTLCCQCIFIFIQIWLLRLPSENPPFSCLQKLHIFI